MANTKGAESTGIGPKLGAATRACGQTQATLRFPESLAGHLPNTPDTTFAMEMELRIIPS